MSGRLEQLARQIRRLRTRASEPRRTLKRALHLALDLAREHDADGFAALASRGLLDAALAERLAARTVDAGDITDEVVVDLDVFLRSIELGAPAQPLPLPPLASAPKLPPGTDRASVNVSGRIVSVIGRPGQATVVVDDCPIAMEAGGTRVEHLALPRVPTIVHELRRDPDGTVHIEWPGMLRLALAPDFASVQVDGA